MARERKTREASEKILEMVEEGVLDRDTVIMACMKYMSEDDVKDMAHANELFDLDDDEEESEPEPEGDDEIIEVDGVNVPWKEEFPSR